MDTSILDKNVDISRKIFGYIDSVYARDLDRRRSLIGYLFTLCGSVISWKALIKLPLSNKSFRFLRVAYYAF